MRLYKRLLPLNKINPFALDLLVALILMVPVALWAADGADAQKLVDAALKSGPDAFRSILVSINNPSPKTLGEALLKSFDGNNYAEIVPMLLDAGADPSYGTERDSGALNKAVNRYIEKSSKISLKIVKLLLNSGSAADNFDENGFTPLMYATSANDFKLARLLIAFNAKPDLQNKDGRSALDMAASDDMRELMQQAILSRPNLWSTPEPSNKK